MICTLDFSFGYYAIVFLTMPLQTHTLYLYFCKLIVYANKDFDLIRYFGYHIPFVSPSHVNKELIFTR